MANLKLASVNEVKIEKGVALPNPDVRKPVWPLRSMEVGDSFTFERLRLTALRSAVTYEQRVSGRRFAIRSLPTEFRCWRIA